MTSHGVKVAARNLALMKSKEADRRAAAAKEAVMEADAQADIIREASEAASAEARIWGNKLLYAEEELDESRRLSEEWETHPRTWSAGPGLRLISADLMGWLEDTNDVSEERKPVLRERLFPLGQAVPMTPDEAKSFAATRSDIYGFTYNNKGKMGGSAWFTTTELVGIWSEAEPHPRSANKSKYEWHDHYEKTS
jgi:hypothetical protein